MQAKFVMSGECRIGSVGDSTNLKDSGGKPLFVGDIVHVLHVDTVGGFTNYGLSVVRSDRWVSINNCGVTEHTESPGPAVHFVMGLKTVDFSKETDEWKIQRVKSFEDTVIDEHWRDYGFSYA